MVVNYLHIERIAAAPDETHTPLIIDTDTMLPRAFPW